jgi:hypothetical protein
MICIFEDELDGLVFPIASNPEVEPVFGRGVQVDIGVAFDFDGQRVVGSEVSCGHVASWEAAVDEDGAGEIEVGAVGMPHWLLLLAVPMISHRLCDDK